VTDPRIGVWSFLDSEESPDIVFPLSPERQSSRGFRKDPDAFPSVHSPAALSAETPESSLGLDQI